MKKLSTLLLVLVAFTGMAQADPATPASLLAAAKAATGGSAWDKIVTWHEKGNITGGGLSGTYESLIDFPTLHNNGTYTLGPDFGGGGWDGTQPWTEDHSKQVRVEASEEATAGTIQDAYRGAYAFYFPDRYPAKMEMAPARKIEGKSYPAIKITPKGSDPIEVWFDPSTHRVAGILQLTGDHPHSYLFSNYTKFGGVMIPGKIIDRTADQPKFDFVGTTTSVDLSGPQPLSAYAPPPPPADDTTWPAGQDSVTIPFHLYNNHIYLEASINGRAPSPFMFDTGATNVIDPVAAKTAGAASQGAMPGGGFGEKVPAFGMAKIKSVSLAGLSIPDQIFTTFSEPGWIAVEGVPSDGLVGYEFAKRAILTVDYAKGLMTFTKPKAFHPPAGVPAVPFTFDSHTPMISATLDGIPGEYELDTGSRAPLTLMIPFVKAHGLTDKYHAVNKGTVGYGVGGPSVALLGRAGKLVIGSATIDAPVVEISADKAGGGQETHMAGNIGGDLLKQFTVTLDYTNRLAWFQPNEANGKPDVFDRSGLWINRAKDGAIEVGDVTTKSAADKLGLKVGDVIESINGKPAKDFLIPDLREQFKGAPGTSFALSIKHAGSPKSVTLVLADQV